MFEVGQQVVCVNDRDMHPEIGGAWDRLLNRRQIYTVRWAGFCVWTLIGRTGDGVRLEGIHRKYSDDTPFCASRFRPLRKTDISVFIALLNPVREDA